jgi:hypothetical protein
MAKANCRTISTAAVSSVQDLEQSLWRAAAIVRLSMDSDEVETDALGTALEIITDAAIELAIRNEIGHD